MLIYTINNCCAFGLVKTKLTQTNIRTLMKAICLTLMY